MKQKTKIISFRVSQATIDNMKTIAKLAGVTPTQAYKVVLAYLRLI